jgi:hypothetical protein
MFLSGISLIKTLGSFFLSLNILLCEITEGNADIIPLKKKTLNNLIVCLAFAFPTFD